MKSRLNRTKRLRRIARKDTERIEGIECKNNTYKMLSSHINQSPQVAEELGVGYISSLSANIQTNISKPRKVTL